MKNSAIGSARFRFGVRQRVVLTLLSGLVLSLTVSGWLVLRDHAQRVHEEINRHGRQLTQIVSHSLANSVVGYDYHGIQLFLDEIALNADVSYVKVVSGKGNVMAETKIDDVNKAKLRMFHTDIRLGESVVGALSLGLNTEPIIKQIESQKEMLVVREAGIILFILVLEFLVLSVLIVNPLSKIAKALAHNSGKDGVLPSSIELNSRDEFGDIARRFNTLREQLNAAHEALKGKADAADRKLKEANRRLQTKSQELEKSNLELSKLTVTDALTGLFNRRKFQEVLTTEIGEVLKAGGLCSLLVADIDRFKAINDRHGHDGGDIVLQEVARRLTETVRKSDVICRVGGEEFAIYCKAVGADDAMRIAEKIRHVIKQHPISVGDEALTITVSLGVATLSAAVEADSPEVVYRQADLALYQSKTTGRDRVTHFDDTGLSVIQCESG